MANLESTGGTRSTDLLQRVPGQTRRKCCTQRDIELLYAAVNQTAFHATGAERGVNVRRAGRQLAFDPQAVHTQGLLERERRIGQDLKIETEVQRARH